MGKTSLKLIINDRKVESPIAIFSLFAFAFFLVGGALAFILFILLPWIGIFISGALALVFVILTPLILWLMVPILFIKIISWVFGKLLK